MMLIRKARTIARSRKDPGRIEGGIALKKSCVQCYKSEKPDAGLGKTPRKVRFQLTLLPAIGEDLTKSRAWRAKKAWRGSRNPVS